MNFSKGGQPRLSDANLMHATTASITIPLVFILHSKDIKSAGGV